MIKVFVPTAENARADFIHEAARIAQYKMDVYLREFPLDTRATDAINSSSVSRGIVRNLVRNGYRQDGVQVFMLNKDIRTEKLSWCFGATHGQMILISDYRIWNSHYNKETKIAMLAYLLEHEIGHAFHAADDIRAQGIFDLHCNDPRCVMQQVLTLGDLAEKARFNITCREANEAECFCPHCRERFVVYSR